MEHVRIFSMFDTERDADLNRLLLAQASDSCSEFKVCAESPPASLAAREDRVRQMIRDADEVVVICGAHTEGSALLGSDFRMVIEEQKPYMLLWGRRELMCTKPPGAKAADAMYSWTLQILNLQIREALRHFKFREAPDGESKRRPRDANAAVGGLVRESVVRGATLSAVPKVLEPTT